MEHDKVNAIEAASLAARRYADREYGGSLALGTIRNILEIEYRTRYAIERQELAEGEESNLVIAFTGIIEALWLLGNTLDD